MFYWKIFFVFEGEIFVYDIFFLYFNDLYIVRVGIIGVIGGKVVRVIGC